MCFVYHVTNFACRPPACRAARSPVLIVLGAAAGFVSPPASVKPRLQRLRFNAVAARDRDRDRSGSKANVNPSSVAARRQKTNPSGSSHQVCVVFLESSDGSCCDGGGFEATPLSKFAD